MQRRDFMKSAALGSLVLGYEASHAFSFSDVMNIADEAVSMAKVYTMGEAEEIQLGETYYENYIKEGGGLYPDDNVQKAIKSFAKPLMATSERQNLPWDIVMLKNDSVNAWALPGGKIAVNSGLIKHASSPEELASVISHEIGHVEKSHGIERIQNQTYIQSAGSALKKTLASFGAGGMTTGILESLEEPVYQMVLSGYSRDNEFEADSHILHVFQKTGLDASKADDFFITLDKLYPSDSTTTTSLFSTHPVTQDRIAAIQSRSKQLHYNTKSSSFPGWNEIKSRLG